MDLATMVGLLLGVGVIGWSFIAGGDPLSYWDGAAFLLIFGGVLGATMIHYKFSDVMSIFNALMRAFMIDIPPAEKVIKDMVEFGRIARRDGTLALEARMKECKDEFLTKGLQLVIDGTESDAIREVMTIEMSTLLRRGKRGMEILLYMAEAAPGLGMVATLIGLVQMLKQLSNPSQIGAGMATALLGTFYGALAANLFFLPMAGKLQTRNKEEEIVRMMMIEGLQGIQSGVSPSVIEDRLLSYLAPAQREGAK
jgi:chemotaxis protein MotA